MAKNGPPERLGKRWKPLLLDAAEERLSKGSREKWRGAFSRK